MRPHFANVFMLLMITAHAGYAEPTKISLGDGHVDGSKLQEYDYTWKQCALQEGEWVSQGDLTESLDIIGDVLRIRQSTQRPGGGSGATSTYVQRHSMAPLRIEIEQTGPDGSTVTVQHLLDPHGYQSTIQRGGQTQQREGEINSNMYLGAAMGLPVSLLDPALYPAEIPASMLVFDASYRVVLTDAGTATIQHNGEPVETHMIDVEWHHLGQGDIYPPGPDASGGRYWVTANPPAGFPYVARYKTDTYAVEFVADICP